MWLYGTDHLPPSADGGSPDQVAERKDEQCTRNRLRAHERPKPSYVLLGPRGDVMDTVRCLSKRASDISSSDPNRGLRLTSSCIFHARLQSAERLADAPQPAFLPAAHTFALGFSQKPRVKFPLT
jgi:hypothetical protein